MAAGSNDSPREPSAETLPHLLPRYLLATRPAFLSVTLIGCLTGVASAWQDQLPLRTTETLLGLFLALLTHAGVNVFNDYYDALNGTDAINQQRLFPFTGGSRFIQNGLLSQRQTLGWAVMLFLLTVAGGVWLIARCGSGLFWIGLAGLLLGWTYSAPPLKLNSRGLGEVCVIAAFLLLPVGMDFIQRGSFSVNPVTAGLSFSLLVCNLLYINQFPDREADLQAGKRHWVARLSPRQARWGYPILASASYGWVAGATLLGMLPGPALLALLSAPLSVLAARELWRHTDQPSLLAPAIRQTIAAACLHGALLSLSLLIA